MKFVFLMMLVVTMSAQAQQTNWMKPNKFRFNQGDTCRITLVQGERLVGTYFPVSKDSVGKVTYLINGKRVDLTSSFVQNEKYHFSIPLTDEGTYQIYWDRFKTFSLSNMQDIEHYLDEFGVGGSPAEIDRSLEINEHTFDILFIQVGKTRSPIVPVSDFSLKIIPDKHPYELKKGDPLRLMITDHDAPVFGSDVTVRNRYDDRTTIQKIFTEKDGSMRLIISSPGPWMINYATIDAYRNIYSIGIKRVNLLFGY